MGELKLDNYSYKDYLDIDKTLKNGERIELIDGEIYFMAGASAEHQDLVGELFFRLKQSAKEQKSNCFPRLAPFDIKLFRGSDKNIVQPDVMLFCEERELPCALFEVLSPSTASKDRGAKKELYERFGIKEYFIVDLNLKIIDSYRLENGKYYYVKGFSPCDDMPIECMDSKIDIAELFGVERPSKEECESLEPLD